MRGTLNPLPMPSTTRRNDYESKEHLVIWQQNLNKSSDAQLDLLHYLYPNQYDIVATQEPYINFLGNTQATSHWITVYPTGHLDHMDKTRALIMINRSSISTNSWTQIDIESPDVVGVQLVSEQGTLRLINIYNSCDNDDAMKAVDGYMKGAGHHRDTRAPLRYVWLGDFNRHSPLWDEERNGHLFTRAHLDAAERMMDVTARYGMTMVLPPGIPTLKAHSSGNLTRVDNMFCDENSVGLIDHCDTMPALRPVKTDHFPIITKIRMVTARNTFVSRRNYRTANWEAFRKTLQDALSQFGPPTEIADLKQAQDKLAQLDWAIDRAHFMHVDF